MWGFFRRDGIRRKVKFHNSCRYDLQSDDQFDINKLFGFGFGLQHHHKNSARFGWRYDKVKECIAIYSYVYNNSFRLFTHIADVKIGETHTFELKQIDGAYWFLMDGGILTMVLSTKEAKTKRKLGVYFGGNRRAPHTMKLTLKKD